MAAVSADQRAPIGPLPAGARLGRYEILAKLAAGGMAIVYVARAQGVAGFERLVAIKVLHANLAHEEEFIKMFLDEARLAASIRHPNVVPTIDISDSEKAGYFIVMEYIEGDHLGQLLSSANKSGEKLPVSVTLRVISDALGGLGAAHDLTDENGKPQNLVHRDVSPHNIMVGRDGVARLTDFGVAKAEDRLTHTRDGQVKGKLAYMAPEQAASGTTDPRSDLFSMGVILWESLTGQRLMRAESTAATLHKLLHSEIPAPSSVDPSLAPLDAVLAKALARDPEQRFQTAEEFAQALENLSGDVTIASLREVGKVVSKYAAAKLKRDKKLIEDALKALRPAELGAIEVLDVVDEVSSPSSPFGPSSSEISSVACAAPNPTSKVSGVFANDTMPGTRRAGRRTLEVSMPGRQLPLAAAPPPPPAGAAALASPRALVAPALPRELAQRSSEPELHIEIDDLAAADGVASLEAAERGDDPGGSARTLRWAVVAIGAAALVGVGVFATYSAQEDVRVEQMPVDPQLRAREAVHAEAVRVHVIEAPKAQAVMVGTVVGASQPSERTPEAAALTRGVVSAAVVSGATNDAPGSAPSPMADATAAGAERQAPAAAQGAASGEDSPHATSGSTTRGAAPQATPRARETPAASKPLRAPRRARDTALGAARPGELPGPNDVIPNPYHD